MAHNGDGTFDDLSDPTILPGILAMADCSGQEDASQRMTDLAVDCVVALGADVTILDLRDLDLPPYENHDDVGLPQGAYAFRQLVCAHDGFLIGLPDEDGPSPSLLLNAIAWSVCPEFGTDATDAYAGKCASLIAATVPTEALERSINILTAKLTQIGILVMPQSALSGNDKPEEDTRLEETSERRMRELMNMFISTIRWAQERSRTASDEVDDREA
jgi:NAD(P)H-dependent FMN reductase